MEIDPEKQKFLYFCEQVFFFVYLAGLAVALLTWALVGWMIPKGLRQRLEDAARWVQNLLP